VGFSAEKIRSLALRIICQGFGDLLKKKGLTFQPTLLR